MKDFGFGYFCGLTSVLGTLFYMAHMRIFGVILLIISFFSLIIPVTHYYIVKKQDNETKRIEDMINFAKDQINNEFNGSNLK